VTARTLQGMARVRPGRLLPDPYLLVRSVRRDSRVKRDFACTFARHLSLVLVVLRSQSRLMLEGRARTLSGPSPALSAARTLAPSARYEDLQIRRSGQVVRDRPSPVVGWADIPELSTCVGRRPVAPSSQLSGGVAQAQNTVYSAARDIGERLSQTDESGAETGEHTYLVRPRSFLILGNLEQLRGQSGVHRAKYDSFELYRRNLHEPEIITFDELFARAEWHVEVLDEES
jgi:hypothetical protein